MTETDLPAATRVGRVALRVTDLDRLADFYRRVVGLVEHRREGDRAVLGVDGGEALLELVHASDAPERALDETGLFHVAFRVPDRVALADAFARVADRWLLDGASDHRVSEALYLRDPEDNGIEIYRDRPREAWPTAADGRVQMDTLQLDIDALAAESGRSVGGDADGSDAATSVPLETTVGHVHLEVSSIPRARAFYVDALGLRVRQAWGGEALFVAAGDYHHHVGLNTWHGCTEPATGRGLDWFELVVPDGERLATVEERLDDHGVTWEPRGDGVAVVDPDGIRVRIVA